MVNMKEDILAAGGVNRAIEEIENLLQKAL